MIKLSKIVEQTYEPIKVGASRLADTQHPDTVVIPQDKVTSQLSKVGAKDWQVEVNDKGIVQIVLDSKFEDYKKTLKFVNDVALLFTDFRNKITEIATTLLPFDFEKFNNNVKTFMNKIRNAFDQLVLNTIKTVKVLTDKSERQLAYDVGLGELYDRMNNTQDNQQQDSEQEGGEGSDSSNKIEQLVDEQDEIDKVIQQGVDVLRQLRDGELTKVDKRNIEGKEPLEVYRYLLDQKITIN